MLILLFLFPFPAYRQLFFCILLPSASSSIISLLMFFMNILKESPSRFDIFAGKLQIAYRGMILFSFFRRSQRFRLFHFHHSLLHRIINKTNLIVVLFHLPAHKLRIVTSESFMLYFRNTSRFILNMPLFLHFFFYSFGTIRNRIRSGFQDKRILLFPIPL